MNKKELNVNIILNKKFNTELSGYNAKEVDMYLDKILKDYQKYDEELETLEDKLEEKMTLLAEKDEEINKLKFEIENNKDQMENMNRNTNPELAKEMSEIKQLLKQKKNLI